MNDLVAQLESLLATADKPVIPDVVPLIRAYYALPDTGCGGSLHIVLEDGNIGNDHVAFCHKHAIEDGDLPGELLSRLLLRMSRTQRHKLYSMNHYPVGVV